MIEAYKMNFAFEEPVRIAWKTFKQSTNCLLMVKTGGLTGYGEATPTIITHDTQRSVFAYLRKVQPPGLVDVETIRNIHKHLPVGSITARAAIDFALHDLWGKQNDETVSHLYSGKTNLVPNCITIFGKSIEETKVDVQKTLARFPHLEVLKIKLMGKEDVQRCRAIKEGVAGKKMSFVLDCNQAYKTAAGAVAVLGQLKEILKDIILVEEPVPARHWNMLKEVSQNCGLPIFADESAVTMKDVKTIIEKECADGINIKLQKTGGILSAKAMAEECEKHGLKVMVGCMFETAIGIAAGINFAQSTKNVILTDLDYDLQLPDIYTQRPGFENGMRTLSNRPGLGVELDFSKINALKNSSRLVFKRIL